MPAFVALTRIWWYQCDGFTYRSVEYHFECDPNAGIGVPRAVFGDCEFVVRLKKNLNWKT
eukprot:1461731-Rhodomonas_salina.1